MEQNAANSNIRPLSKSGLYRKNLREQNPEKYELYKAKQREKGKERRAELKKILQKRHASQIDLEKRKRSLELQRIRQKKYSDKRKTSY